MWWFAVPAIMSGISAVVGGIGAANAREDQERYQKRAEEYLNMIQNLSKEQLRQADQRRAKWESVFGSISENLANYYKSLDPNTERARRFQLLEKQYSQMNTRLNETLASRGMAASGLAAQAQADLTSNLANQKAEAAYQTQGDIAKQQAGFYSSVGLPQQQSILQQEANAYNLLGQAYSQGMSINQQLANQSGQMANAGMAQVGQALGNIASSVASYGMASELGLFDSLSGAAGAAGTMGSTTPAASMVQPAQSTGWDLNQSFLNNMLKRGV